MVQEPTAPSPPATTTPPPVRDDMDDTAELRDPVLPAALREALAAIQETLVPVYAAADGRAVRAQTWHRLITTLAAATGTLAVLFAIAELGSRALGVEAGQWMAHVEAVFLFACLLSVILGLTAALQTGWLDERHRAERCRMLKFRLLTRPELWDGRGAEWHQLLRDEQAVIAAAPPGWAKAEAHSDPAPEPLPEIPSGAIAPDALQLLGGYYLAKRLDYQRQFYASRVARFDRRDRRLRHLPPLCFFASVAAALVNYLLSAVGRGAGAGGAATMATTGVLLLVFAAAVPVIGAGVRTYRMAYEFARSASLFQAKLHALEHFRQLLQHDLAAAVPDAGAVLRRLGQVENFFEHEHHEWLRLMLEAEWFG